MKWVKTAWRKRSDGTAIPPDAVVQEAVEEIIPDLDPDELAPANRERLNEFLYKLPRMLAVLGHMGPRGPENGPPALVIPGFLANDRSTMDMRRALAWAGWRVHPWLLGINRGAKAETLEQICSRIEAIYDGRPILLVGWSLGGMFAREVAHLCPDKIRAIVTLGSPFSGDVKTSTNITEFYEKWAGHKVDEPPFPRAETRPPQPCLAFWSRMDGIVAPAAARGSEDEVDRSIEVATRHAGFALDRRALGQVVRGITAFLTELEGKPPELIPMAERAR